MISTFTITAWLFVQVSIRLTTFIGPVMPRVSTVATLTCLLDPPKLICPYPSESSTSQKVSHSAAAAKVAMAIIGQRAYFRWREAVEITSVGWTRVTNSIADSLWYQNFEPQELLMPVALAKFIAMTTAVATQAMSVFSPYHLATITLIVTASCSITIKAWFAIVSTYQAVINNQQHQYQNLMGVMPPDL